MTTESRGLKGWFQEEKKQWMKQPVYSWIIDKESERSWAGLGSQDTPKLLPPGFPILVTDTIIHPVARARNLGIILVYPPSQ